MTAPVQVPVCRVCGSEELRSIERLIEWRIVDFVPLPHGLGWGPGDDWQDSQGDADSISVGIVCGDCYTETAAPDYAPDGAWNSRTLVTTRAAYNRTHALRSWWVDVERFERQPDGSYARPVRRVKVQGRDEREANEAAGGSNLYGRRPWPVGTPDPNKKEAVA